MNGRRMRLVVLLLVVWAVAVVAGCAGRSQSVAPADPATVYRVSGPLVNLLSCPSLTCSVVEDLTLGQQVAVTAAYPGGWVAVRAMASGREGFVLRQFLARP